MRFLTALLFTVISSYFIVLGSGIPVSAQDASIVRATRVDGTVTKNGAPLKEGDIIQRDDKIVTKDKSAALLTWSNGSMVEIYPKTSLILKGVVFERDRKMEKTLLVLERGRLFTKAQVPEHIFTHFEIRVGNTLPVLTQGAEFAIKYDDSQKEVKIWSLIRDVVVRLYLHRIRVEEGQQVVLKLDGKPETPIEMSDRMKKALIKVSKRLGGSLLIEEEITSTGGPLMVKIGGVKNRRGDVPYTVKFKAIIGGGSGKIRSISWNFGDGETAEGKEVQHTYTMDGVYVVTLRVEDENGQKATSQITISAEEECAC
jgi:hypothetical protein